MKKQELLEKLQSSEELIKMAYLPLYQVIEWVKELEPETTNYNDFVDSIVDEIISNGVDLIEDYELSMSYREVELDSVEFNSKRLKNIIEKCIE